MTNNHIPSNHPRAKSLYIRNLLVSGFKSGLVVPEGLLAHGRGEAFDYLIGEHTSVYALHSIKAASSLLLLADHPVISVNGNSAALCAKEMIELANYCNAFLEVNLFYKSRDREYLISETLKKNGANIVLGLDKKNSIDITGLTSSRRHVDLEGIYKADVVLVPLEDGDRTSALIKMKKKVITIDLNPLSRTAQFATISIIDNIVRTMPYLVETTKKLKNMKRDSLQKIVDEYDNQYNLVKSIELIRRNAGSKLR